MSFSQDAILISQELLYAARTEDSTDDMVSQLAAMDPDTLNHQLKTDDERKAFWINIYNAYTLIRLKNNPEAYKKRNRFFTAKAIRIAGSDISLDLIEHGILRRSKWKYSLGHFNKLFKSRYEKMFRVNRLDYRIHFALNCGARSCPPIAYYKPEQISKQLGLAEKGYLKNEVIYHASENRVEVPAIMSWFRGDFGGKKGILRMLKDQHLIPEQSTPRIQWKEYHWDLDLKNFTD